MRNLKKFLALVLAMLMVVSAAATVSAFDDVTEEHDFYVAIQDLVGKEIVKGVDENTFNPEGDVTRLQAAIMFARAITGDVGDDAVWNKGLSMFSDVESYQYAVTVAVNAGIINGMGDGTYNPAGNIQFIQALKMAVCALGYGEGLTWGADGMEYYNVAVDKGLTAGLDYIAEATKPLNRGEFAQLIYNMINAELADGTGTIAYNIFKVGYVEPVEPEPVVEMTTFIITATDEQTAYEGMDVAEGDYVGIQQLVNGVAAGDMIYVPVEVFGFEGDADEAAFLHAYNLANYDAETGAFDYVEATGDSWKIYNAEISGINNTYNRFKYDNSNYYAVEELTGSAIRNEVVIYNTVDYALDDGNKQLFLNADGQVLDPEDGTTPVLEAVYSVTGNIVSYRVLVTDASNDVKKGDYISVAKATSLYGAVVDYVAESYTIVDAAQLSSGAYELTVFDDDNDGDMDRAYYTPVYMSVYEGVNGSKEHQTWGPFKGYDDDKSGNIAITGMEDLASGDIFVYTYNEQLKEVTVLDVLELQEGTVKKISTLKQSTSDGYSVITLEDGTALTLYNYDKASGVDAKLGAAVQKSGDVNYTKDAWISQLTSTFEYIDDDELLADLGKGSLIRYYARNNILVFGETYNIEDVYERVILKEVIDADLEAIYADVYRNGAVEEIEITMINGKAVSEISWIKLSSVLSDFADEAGQGYIYKIAETADGWQISAPFIFDEKGANPANYGLVKMTEVTENEDGDALVYGADYAQDIVISDNIAEIPTAQNGTAIAGYNKYNRLRTNENTIWYFINETDDGATVKVFSGEIEEGVLAVDGADIYVDALGYGSINKKAGTASVVYVYNADLDECSGFGWGDGDRSIIYVSTAIETAHTWDYYEKGDAEELGLDAKTYTNSNYFKYEAKYIMDMYTGKAQSVFSDDVLTAGNFYYINEDGYVVDHITLAGSTVIGKANLAFQDLDYDTVDLTITGILDDWYEVDTIAVLSYNGTSIKVTASDIDDIITKDNTATTKKETVVCYYLKGYGVAGGAVDEDGRFAIVAGADLTTYQIGYEAPKADPNKKVSGADVAHSTHTGALEATMDSLTVGTNVAAKLTIWNAKASVALGKEFTAIDVSKNSADINDITVKVTKLATSISKADTVISGTDHDGFNWKLASGSTFTNGVLTIKGIDNPASAVDTFEAGVYEISMNITHAAGAWYNVTFTVTVD